MGPMHNKGERQLRCQKMVKWQWHQGGEWQMTPGGRMTIAPGGRMTMTPGGRMTMTMKWQKKNSRLLFVTTIWKIKSRSEQVWPFRSKATSWLKNRRKMALRSKGGAKEVNTPKRRGKRKRRKSRRQKRGNAQQRQAMRFKSSQPMSTNKVVVSAGDCLNSIILANNNVESLLEMAFVCFVLTCFCVADT